ncbi:SDR family NAD(P)-dependent oxidoreductase [Pseudomonas shirazensis]|uniref:SDR family NAD(P)-dependent oxidoreductase n=1 Tax=Pseudomonas TaxID=286 RepID=UPI003988308A
MNPPDLIQPGEQHAQRVIVTGGASGVGYETARAMVLAGAEVLIADVDYARAEHVTRALRQETADARVSSAEINLADLNSIHRFCQKQLYQGQPLSVLFNNAGIQPLSNRRETVDGFELAFGIGHLGHFALTARLLPLLLQCKSPRVVTTSSLIHRRGRIDPDDLQITRGYDAQRAYNQTKLANLLFARELQRRSTLSNSHLLSFAAHPGVAKTAIGSNRQRHGPLRWQDHLVGLTLSVVMPLLGQDAAKGALPLLHAATARGIEPGILYGPAGFGEMKGLPAPARMAPAATDGALADWLWRRSEELCKVDFHWPVSA